MCLAVDVDVRFGPLYHDLGWACVIQNTDVVYKLFVSLGSHFPLMTLRAHSLSVCTTILGSCRSIAHKVASAIAASSLCYWSPLWLQEKRSGLVCCVAEWSKAGELGSPS